MKIESWQCETDEDPALIGNIIDSFDSIDSVDILRNKKSRTVFKQTINGTLYYIKLNHPVSFFQKLKEIIYSKSYSELISIQKLQKSGLPVIKIIAYGKKKSTSFLVTEDAGVDAYNAFEYWFQTAKYDNDLRGRYLNAFSCFVKQCLNADFIHPDFHLGNILVKAIDRDFKFMFVDPYGIKFKDTGKNIFKNGMVNLLFFLRFELTDPESLSLLINSGIAENKVQAEDVVENINSYSVDYINGKWKKRKNKLLNKESRFSSVRSDEDWNTWYLRKDFSGELLIKNSDLKLDILKNDYLTVRLNRMEAIERWLFSFYLQFQQIPHIRPVALFLPSTKNPDAVLISENPFITQINNIELERIKKILYLCKTCGVKITNSSDNVIMVDNKPMLIDSDPHKFQPPAQFYT